MGKTGPVHTDRTTPIATPPVPWLLEEAVRRFPERPAMDFLGKKTAYAELARLVDAAARGFQKLGVVRGSRVALCLPNTPYYIISYFAVLKIGGVVVNLNPLYVERELRHLIEDSGAAILVTLDIEMIYRKIAPLLGEGHLKKVVMCSMADALPLVKKLAFSLLKRKELCSYPADDKHVSFARLIAGSGAPDKVAIDVGDIAVLQYTGGTTGIPKAAMLTHANLTANCDQLARLVPGMPVGSGAMMVMLPLFHVFAMTVAMNLGIYFAAELVLLPRFDKDLLRKTIARTKPIMFPGVPTLYTSINEAAAQEKNWDLSSIKYCVSGGAPLPAEVRTRFEAISGCKLVEGYGLSEASPVATTNPMEAVKDGSIGLPLPGTIIEIRDREDPAKILPQGEKGEVCIRGPQVMKGYWQRPDETANVFIDGALRTGDVGYIDEDGYVYLVDRIKDLIISGGFNVYPRVVEEAIYLHPAVAEAVVIGIPDAHRGQVPKAFIRLRDNQSATVEELQAFLAENLSPVERPKQIEFRAELPKTLVGKLSKKELVAEELAKRAAGQVS